MPLMGRPNWVDDNGNPVDDSVLIADDYLPVEMIYPAYDQAKQYVRQRPMDEWEVLADKVVAKFEVIDFTPEELSGMARNHRNMLLAQSDWTQGKDIPDAISTPWAAYRQALRDLPEQPGFPATIDWPVPQQ